MSENYPGLIAQSQLVSSCTLLNLPSPELRKVYAAACHGIVVSTYIPTCSLAKHTQDKQQHVTHCAPRGAEWDPCRKAVGGYSLFNV